MLSELMNNAFYEAMSKDSDKAEQVSGYITPDKPELSTKDREILNWIDSNGQTTSGKHTEPKHGITEFCKPSKVINTIVLGEIDRVLKSRGRY